MVYKLFRPALKIDVTTKNLSQNVKCPISHSSSNGSLQNINTRYKKSMHDSHNKHHSFYENYNLTHYCHDDTKRVNSVGKYLQFLC